MFATLAGGYPWPPDIPPEAALEAVVAAQVEAGLGLLSDGRVHAAAGPARQLVAAWEATSEAATRYAPGLPVKLAVEGPWTAGGPVGAIEAARALQQGLAALAEAGCPVVEVHEPAAALPPDDDGRAAFAAAHRALLDGLPDRVHLSLAITGGDATALGAAALFAAPYRSHLFDLVDGPESWRLIAVAPPERGIVVGVGDAGGRRRTRMEDVIWAASYAASTQGRGMDRVGIAPSGSLAGLARESARAVIDVLGEAARTIASGRDEVLARLDPRAIDARSGALGHYRPERGRGPAGRRPRPPTRPHATTRTTTTQQTTKEPAAPMPTRYWHPFADMHKVQHHELVLVRGAGAWIEDADGRRYLDATAGLWYCNVGHGRTEIADAAAGQLSTLAAYSNFGPFATAPTLELADRLTALAPMEGATVFFGSGGSDGVDTAAKLARRYWDALGHTEKRIVVSREHAYHGMHAFGTGLAGIPAMQAGYGGPMVGDTIQVSAHDVEELEHLFKARGKEIAAFIGEPVIGAGGVIPPDEGYWETVTRLCDAHGVLLVADEVITGFGRLGTMFGSERYEIAPDMICFAKGVTSGYLPLGGVLIGRRVAEPFWDGASGSVFRHGYTYSGHATACAAALANLDILEGEDLVGRVRALEPVLAREIARLDDAPLVGETRVVGLTAAVELDADVLAANPGAPEVVAAALRRHGILTRVLRGVALQVSPPFVITEAEIRTMVDGFEAALAEVAAG